MEEPEEHTKNHEEPGRTRKNQEEPGRTGKNRKNREEPQRKYQTILFFKFPGITGKNQKGSTKHDLVFVSGGASMLPKRA